MNTIYLGGGSAGSAHGCRGGGGGGGHVSRGGDIQIPISTTATHPSWFRDYSKISQLIFTGAVVVMYMALLGLLQLKFHNKRQSPFETHGSFMIMSVLALAVATTTSGLLLYLNESTESQIWQHFGSIHYMILKTTFCFSALLAPLSLFFTLTIPDHDHHWIGYVFIFTFFAAVIGCNVFSYINQFTHERDQPDQMTLANV